MKKWIFLLYSIACYLVFFGTFIYLVGFVQNLYFQKTIDRGDISESLLTAIAINTGLLFLFGFQHSTMARKSFKETWLSIIPSPIERSTYVFVSSLILLIIMIGWQPIPIQVWDFTGQTLGNFISGFSWLGWALLLLSTFSINHFHLFGLFQPYKFITGQLDQALKFKIPLLYKLVRHPLYLGFLISFWFAPLMTIGHLLFSSAMTLYILIGITMEEKDLVSEFGKDYEDYRKKVPKLIPLPHWLKNR